MTDSRPQRDPVAVCRLDELRDGEARGFDPWREGEDTLIVIMRSGSVRAFYNRCPHQGARLEYRKDGFLAADGWHILCHAHGARFDSETGQCVYGPCAGALLTAVPTAIEVGRVLLPG